MKSQLFIAVASILSTSYIQAQEFPQSPSQWSTFVSSAQNKLVDQILLKQSFENEATDQWSYETNGTITDLSTYGINNIDGNKALKLTRNQNFTLGTTPTTPYLDYYTGVRTLVDAAGYRTKKGCILKTEHSTATEVRLVDWITIKSESSYTFPFAAENTQTTDILYEGNQKTRTFEMLRNLQPYSFRVNDFAGTADYAFFIDNIRIIGKASMYTMTNAEGAWAGTEWSHNRPNMHTSALIAHNKELNTHEKCNSLHIGNASLSINSNGSLYVSDNLVFHAQTNSSTLPELYNNGALSISNNLEFHVSFDQKGKWVFVSFPHDVYISDIDNSWSMGDASTTTGGNKFYVRKYDADKRAGDGSSGWKVIQTTDVNSSTPLFERNKGYLIAIDQTATTQTLPVYIHSESMLPTFATNATVSIPAALHDNNPNSGHSGWHLMGNPFPATITVDYLLATMGSGYELFTFDGNEYIKLESGSGHTIKPFGAFFVKAQQTGTISLRNQKAV